ncbi:MAG: NAD-dependent epimerase/dehydratase family protein [Acidimicrobiia bacterium]
MTEIDREPTAPSARRMLVTGAAGFVGSHLVDALLERGDAVVGIDSFTPYYDPETKRRNLDAASATSAFSLVEADLREADLMGVLDGVDTIFHQAAQPGVRLSWSSGFSEYASHNVLATQRLLEAARDAGVRRVVYASSSSVYGNQQRYPTIETDLPRPYSPYGVTKLAAEHLCGLYTENWGLPTVALRYFTVFGPRQRPDMSIHRLCEAVLTGDAFPRFGDGRQVREFTYVADIVAANLAAADADVEPGTVMNIAGGGEIELNDLIAMVGDLAGTEVVVEDHPAQAGDARRNGGATGRAYELLGWQPVVGLRDGIAAQLAWHEARPRVRV